MKYTQQELEDAAARLQAEREDRIYKEGYDRGHEVGYEKGEGSKGLWGLVVGLIAGGIIFYMVGYNVALF